MGRGAVKVSYDGKQLSIDGTFGGMVSPATDAHLCQGVGIGVQGTCGPALTVSQDTSGSVTGTITLTGKVTVALDFDASISDFASINSIPWADRRSFYIS